jgi:P27 family predicted phage terminase small subunit
MAGRKPKPTALKKLTGNPGKRALNHNEPKPDGTPKCPPHLDKAARAEWKRVATDLKRLGMLTSMDRAALAAYCSAWSRWIAAEQSIAKFGTVIKSPKSGYPIQNPYVGIANTALDNIRKFGVEFGLTPSSRSRLNVDTTPPADSFESFMAGIGADDIVAPEEITQSDGDS